MTNKRIILIITLIVSTILMVIGATMAYWFWISNDASVINITTSMGGMGMTFNGGGKFNETNSTFYLDNYDNAYFTMSPY